ncbi:MAG: hypothetical protein MUO39_15245, partial [Steroidobacteraceae bacterium]|nr:hypothetical protein [Steroidobacteraceae bacterium]
MRRPHRLIAGLLLTLSMLAGFEAVGAPEGDPKPSTEPVVAPAAPVVEAVAPAEIPIQAEADERFIQEKLELARRPDPADKLVPRLDALAAGVLKLSDAYKQDELRMLPAIRLESLSRHWSFYDTQLAAWRAQLQRVTAGYSEAAADLASRRAVWGATRESAGELPLALAKRVDAILAEIAQAEQALSRPLDNQLKLARRGSALRQEIDSGTKAVASAINYIDRRLYTIDSPPLWEAWAVGKPSTLGLTSLRVGLQ